MSTTGICNVKLQRLATMLVSQVGVTAGDHVLLHSYRGAEELASLTAKAAYDAGASFVDLQTCDPAIIKAQLQSQPDQAQHTYSAAETAAWQEVMDKNGCVIQLRLDPDPALWGDVSQSYSQWYQGLWPARNDFFRRGVSGGEFAWILFYVPTDSMAQKIYPEVPSKDALTTYWDAIFDMTMASDPDGLSRLQAMESLLDVRASQLNTLGINTLHFTGPQTDLTIAMTTAARWQRGVQTTNHASPRYHTLNLPTYEIYTTPNWRTAEGTVRATKDIIIDGTLVTDAMITFAGGEVTDVSATAGVEALENLVATPGGNRVGEVALVGLDSPTATRKRVFQSMLLDENAACHIALGSAYIGAITDGHTLTPTQRDELGINSANVHVDVMISDEQTNVTATTHDGAQVPLIVDGHWTKDFQ